MREALIDQKPHSRGGLKPYIASCAAGAAVGIAAAIWLTHLSPLTTHHVIVPLDSAATTPPVPLEAVLDLPNLMVAGNACQRCAIVAGALLQARLTRLSIPALERAIERD